MATHVADTWLPERWRVYAAIAATVAAVVAAVALLWSAAEAHYRGCLEKANVEYPPVAVSAFVGASRANVGPLKVAYAQERITAANNCHRL